MNLSSTEITIFLISISIILFFARGLGELLRLIKQPIVIGEIIAGIVIGPTIFGSLFPEIYDKIFNQYDSVAIALHGISILGIIMLLIVTGIEIDISVMIKQGRKSFLISLLGILCPFMLGFLTAYFFPSRLGLANSNLHIVYSLFIGTTLSVTALPVVARTLMELNIFKTEIGFSIITSAMLIDLSGWLIFSVLLGVLGKNQANNFEVYEVIVILVAFTLFVFLFLKKFIDKTISFSKKYLSSPGAILNIIFILGFLGAAFTEFIGIHAIFGAFIIGIAIGDSVYITENIKEMINQLVTNIFAPLFFVSIGLKINFIQNFDFVLVCIFLSLSLIGKIIGTYSGAFLSGFNKYESLTVAFGLNAHGTIEIVLGMVAYESGLISEKVYVALIIMALITTLTSAPLMSIFIKRSKMLLKLSDLLKPQNIIFTDVDKKEELIKQLCRHICQINNKINCEKLISRVIERENQISTGLESHLAVPHARMNIQAPLAALAIHKRGIDFDSIDNLPARLIILLITPENKPEMQLELLSEIAAK
ncbi:MAG: cation:proton antiporter, partial [Melioribacter sp.]|nr:cation:proton antiporter [Melioribacter sp.]